VSGPSQPKVEGEQWSDERIAGFLSLKPHGDMNVDYHVLLQAYHHMTPTFFARFIPMFVAAGRDLNALSPEGQTMLSRITEHASSGEYADILKAQGAR
jgi:hypothetical protein